MKIWVLFSSKLSRSDLWAGLPRGCNPQRLVPLAGSGQDKNHVILPCTMAITHSALRGLVITRTE